MVIDEKNNFIYIHIPKAGGTTITKFLIQNVNTSKKINTRGDTHHGIATFYSDKLIKKELNNYYKFLTVRNPWDWYVSLYEYTKKGNCHEWRLFNEGGNPNFKEWLNRIAHSNTTQNTFNKFENDTTSTATLYKKIHNKSNLNCGWLTHRFIYSSTLSWENIFSDGNLKEFENNYNSLVVIDNIFKLESLKNGGFSSKFLKSLNKVNEFANFGRKNVTSGKKPYRTYYDNESIEWVKKQDRFLIEKFNYEF